MTVKQFKDLCEGDDLAEFYDETEDKRKPYAFEDDGTLHVHFRKIRACFDVSGCGDDPIRQNENTLRILTKLGMEDLYGPLTMADEAEDSDEDECCPECGCHCSYCG